MIDLAASHSCALGFIREGKAHGPTVYAAPATFIVGDTWITLKVGQTKWVKAPKGVEPRLATEADVTEHRPFG